MKAILSLLTILMSVSAAHAVSAQEISDEVAAVAKKHKADLTEEQRVMLETQYAELSEMTKSQLLKQQQIVMIQKQIICRIGDVFIIAQALGESVPVGTMAVREYDVRKFGYEEIGGQKLMKISAIELIANRLSWANAVGGLLESVPVAAIEAVATTDLSKVEAALQKVYPGAQLLAVKLKGEASTCGKKTLKLDMIKSILDKKFPIQ